MLVYLAGPIDSVTARQANNWREDAIVEFAVLSSEVPDDSGFITYSPSHAFSVTGEVDSATADKLIDVNNSVIARSDAVLAKLDGKSFGTPIEVMLALQRGIPVFSFGLGPKSIYRHKVQNFGSLEPAVEAVAKHLTTSLMPGPNEVTSPS